MADSGLGSEAVQTAAGDAQIATPVRNTVLFGADGLRAGWSLLLFFVILAVMVVSLNVGIKVVHKLRAGTAQQAEQNKAVQSKTDGNKPQEAKPGQMIFAEAVPLALVLVATWIMAKIERRPFLSFGLAGRKLAGRFAVGAVWGFVCLSLLILLLVKTHLLAIDGVSLHGAAAWKYAGLWWIGFLLVGLFEETLVRGYVLVTLARGLAGKGEKGRAWGFFWAALVMGVLFGAMHGGNPGESPIGLISAGSVGVIFAFSFWRTGSLWWAIGFHTAWDWAQSYLYGVADSGTWIYGHLLTAHSIGKPVLSGGTVGPEGSVFILPVLLLATVIVAVTLKRKPAEI